MFFFSTLLSFHQMPRIFVFRFCYVPRQNLWWKRELHSKSVAPVIWRLFNSKFVWPAIGNFAGNEQRHWDPSCFQRKSRFSKEHTCEDKESKFAWKYSDKLLYRCLESIGLDLGKIARVTCIFCLSKIFISIFRRQRLTTATFNTKTFERKISGKKETFSFLLRVLSFVVKRVFRF